MYNLRIVLICGGVFVTPTIFIYITGIIIACVLIIIFARPIRAVVKIAVNSALGGLCIIIFNFISQLFGFFIGVNALTAVTVGILGIPGFVMLLMLQLVLN